MTTEITPITILLDEGTPILAAQPFLSRGHRAIFHADVLESGARDDIVVATALLNSAVLVAIDLDFKRLVRRFGGPSSGEKFSSLHLILLGSKETLAAKRLEHAMTFIENEWVVASGKKARRLWLSVEAHRLTSYR